MGMAAEDKYTTQIGPQLPPQQTTTVPKPPEQTQEPLKKTPMSDLLDELVNDLKFIETLLGEFTAYCQVFKSKVEQDPELLKNERSRIFAVNPKYSHEAEISSRLNFLKEFAANSDFVIQRAQLQVIYDQLSCSPLESDITQFLTWCKTNCKV
jgi:hypothetical protein